MQRRLTLQHRFGFLRIKPMVPLPTAAGPNIALLAGAALSAIASLLHVGIIIGGASWYLFLVPAKRWHALPKIAAFTPPW